MIEKNKRQLQAESTRQAIIDATISLMKHKRLSELKIREITSLAQVSVGTFYLYFSCKEAVLLYGYRNADQQFVQLALQGSKEENLTALLDTYLHMVHIDHLAETREIYLAHLTYHDAYFFDENRPVFQLFKKEIMRYEVTDEDAAKLTWKLLEFARGAIYNLCIHEDGYELSAWHEQKRKELWEYLLFLIHQIHY